MWGYWLDASLVFSPGAVPAKKLGIAFRHDLTGSSIALAAGVPLVDRY